MGGECSHHCVILVPLCFPWWIINNIVEYHCSLISAPSPFWELARAWNWGPSEDQVCLCLAKEERFVECDSSAGEFLYFNSLRSSVTKSFKIQIVVTVTNLCGTWKHPLKTLERFTYDPWKIVSVSVRYLFYQPMDDKIKTWPLRFLAEENSNMEKALLYWPIVSQYDVKAKYRLISRKFLGRFFTRTFA